jgi:hypothetical protein
MDRGCIARTREGSRGVSGRHNPERARVYNRAWHASHREERAVYNRAWHASHREERAVYGAAYRAAHQEEAAVYNRAHYAAHREEMLARAAHRISLAGELVWITDLPIELRAIALLIREARQELRRAS